LNYQFFQGLTEEESKEFKFGPDQHWMRLYDNYLSNHLYENDGVGGNFANYDDLVYPFVNDKNHDLPIAWPNEKYYGDHGTGRHAGVSTEKYGKFVDVPEGLIDDASKLAEMTEVRHQGWTGVDHQNLLKDSFYSGSSSKNLKVLKDYYEMAGVRWSEPGQGGFDGLGDISIEDDVLAGASLRYIHDEMIDGVESKELKAIDPREQFFQSFEDELGLTKLPIELADVASDQLLIVRSELSDTPNYDDDFFAALGDSITDYSSSNSTHQGDESPHYDYYKWLEGTENGIPDNYKHDFSDYDKLKRDPTIKENINACTAKIYDPLNRFQPWDSRPQIRSSDDSEEEIMAETFILADPEIVAPYS